MAIIPRPRGQILCGQHERLLCVKLNAMSPVLSTSARLYAAQDALTKAQTELTNAIVAAAQDAVTRPIEDRMSKPNPLPVPMYTTHAGYWREYIDKRTRTNPKTGCHEWFKRVNPGGHGVFRTGKYTPRYEKKAPPALLVHRVSWAIANGEDPGGRLICHRCDNPPCANPAHLYAGTHKDNAQDILDRHPKHESKRQAAKLQAAFEI